MTFLRRNVCFTDSEVKDLHTIGAEHFNHCTFSLSLLFTAFILFITLSFSLHSRISCRYVLLFWIKVSLFPSRLVFLKIWRFTCCIFFAFKQSLLNHGDLCCFFHPNLLKRFFFFFFFDAFCRGQNVCYKNLPCWFNTRIKFCCCTRDFVKRWTRGKVRYKVIFLLLVPHILFNPLISGVWVPRVCTNCTCTEYNRQVAKLPGEQFQRTTGKCRNTVHWKQ